MDNLPSLEKLIDAFSSFKSVGKKSAERIAFNLLNMTDDEVEYLVKTIKEAKENIHQCPNCGALIDKDECPYCESNLRNHDICIVLSYPKDVFIFDKLEDYRGQYHVLNGEISSVNNVNIDSLNIEKLEKRIDDENIKEIILATNTTVEGEVTALYIAKVLERDKENVKVSRLARGLPSGNSLDYIDDSTLLSAIKNRTEVK